MDAQLSKQYLYGKKHAENVHEKLVSDPFDKESKTNKPYTKCF